MKRQLIEDILGDQDEDALKPVELPPPVGWTDILAMVDRRERSGRQHMPCPACGSAQVQLIDWTTEPVKMKCRYCKHKFEKVLKPVVAPTPVGCEAYCMCPACNGPGHAEWVKQGKPTLCTDGQTHLMGHPGYPIVKELK